MPEFPVVKSLPMPQYLLHDWDPDGGITLEDWCIDLAGRGWTTWAGTGEWTTINGRRVFRVPLRREGSDLKAELAQRRAESATRTQPTN